MLVSHAISSQLTFKGFGRVFEIILNRHPDHSDKNMYQEALDLARQLQSSQVMIEPSLQTDLMLSIKTYRGSRGFQPDEVGISRDLFLLQTLASKHDLHPTLLTKGSTNGHIAQQQNN